MPVMILKLHQETTKPHNPTKPYINNRTNPTNPMYAIGHMALAYLTAKTTAKPLRLNPNIPTILVLSIIPDTDIILGIEQFHRGPTHSIIAATLIFIPLFIAYRKTAIPYFFAILSHPIVDLLGGKEQLLWPLTTQEFSTSPPLPPIQINSTTNAAIELTLFTIALVAMYKAKDIQKLLKPNKTNLLLTLPITTVLLPTFLAYPLSVPNVLIPPHLFYLTLFTTSTLITLYHTIKRIQPKNPKTTNNITNNERNPK